MSIFVFHNEQARLAVYRGQRVFSRKEFPEEAIAELKAWNDRFEGKPGFKFVD